MVDPGVNPAPATGPDPDSTATPEPVARRRRFSRLLLGLLVLCVLLAAGAGVLVRSARQDRREARADQASTSSRLDAQQVATDGAQSQLDRSRQDATTAIGALATPLVTAQRAADLANQGMAAYRDMQSAAESGSASAYNEALRRANDLVKQYNDAIQQFSDQMNQAGNPATPA